jgi:hypothetical protein
MAALSALLLLTLPPAAAQRRLFPGPAPDAADAPAAPVERAAPQPDPETLRQEEALPREAEPRAEPPQGLEVRDLPAPSPNTLGVGGLAAGDLGRQLWRGSDARLILALMPDLPVATANPAEGELVRRLLATGGTLEGGYGPEMFQERVDALLRMGAIDAAGDLLDQLRPADQDPALVRQAIEVALLAGGHEKACGTNDVAAIDAVALEQDFRAKIVIFCRLFKDDLDGARLGLDLLRERGLDDPAFAALASEVGAWQTAGGEPAVPEDGLTPLTLALMRLAGRAPGAEALVGAPPALLAAVLRDAQLTRAATPALAEQAFVAGLVDGGRLRDLYLADPAAGSGDMLQRIESDWGPATRAALVRAIDQEPVLLAKTELMVAAWQAAGTGGERLLLAELFAEPIAGLPPARDLAWAAPVVARVLLASGRTPLAERWLELLRGERTREAELAAERLAAVMALGGADIGSGLALKTIAVPPDDEEAPEAVYADLERLFALADGVGEAVPPAAWHQVIRPAAAPAPAPPAGYWQGLQDAAAGQRRGEAVLFALHMLGEQPEAAHPEAVRLALGALRTVGLGAEARQIALLTAIAAGL